MAAHPPKDGFVLVLGTAEEVGVPLLEKADDPQDVIAYAGYGFWAPKDLVKKVKGLKAVDVDTDPIAPVHGEQAVEIPALDGEVADEHPQGTDEEIEVVDPTAENVAQQKAADDESPAETPAE